MKIETLKYIRKINHAAKYCGKMKQISYDSKKFEHTIYYKEEEQRLYLLKSLLMLSLEEKGEIKRGKKEADKNGCVLETFTSNDGAYKFHSVSQLREAEIEKIYAPERNISENKIYYLPYEYALKRVLSGKYKRIYEIIIGREYYINDDELIELKAFGVNGEIINEEYDGWCEYKCQLYLGGIKLCKIKYLLAARAADYDWRLTDKTGFLELEEYDPYESYI